MSTRMISARPCGHDAAGAPLRPRLYRIDRAPEDWGDGRSRIFVENRSVRSPKGGYVTAPLVVETASITVVA